MQKIIDYNSMLAAIDIICRFCTATNSIRCKSCGANLTIKENYDKLSMKQKEMVEAPWNGLENPLDTRTFEWEFE